MALLAKNLAPVSAPTPAAATAPPQGEPPPSLPPSPAHSDGADAPPVAPTVPPAAPPAAPPAVARQPSLAALTQIPPAGHPAGGGKRWVRLTCNGCHAKLRAQIPLSAKRISTTCTACRKTLQAVVPAAAAMSGAQTLGQSGRARHLAGEAERTSSHEMKSSAAPRATCSCAPHVRKVLVQHPTGRLEQLIETLQRRLQAPTAA